MHRVLVVRGGAIGDFVLTLPAIKTLRTRWPDARLEILGYKHIAALAENRFYAEATRSIESGALASFFARNGDLDPEARAYFKSFDLIVSYLFDPDGVFKKNLGRCSHARYIQGPAKLTSAGHAARQLAHPLERLALTLPDTAAELFPNKLDYTAADAALPATGAQFVGIHPGSGSPSKNWPVDYWRELVRQLLCLDENIHIIVIGGEADAVALTALRAAESARNHTWFVAQPLTTVAALLSRCAIFIGHDSGISHIAAAVGTPCVLLFGGTDPTVWAPTNESVSVLRPPSLRVSDISVPDVLATSKARLGMSATS